jgi:hypothetical protein
MSFSNVQTTCDHQLIFSNALDHAATCAHCGAIIVLGASAHDDDALDVQWIHTSDEAAQETTDD